MSYKTFLETILTEDLNRIVCDKDISLFDVNDISVLLYFFPLIERLIVEILDLSTLINIECKEQGTLRTVNSMIQQEEIHLIFDEPLIKKISKYYGDDGLRNIMMHFYPNMEKISCSIEEINEIKEIAIILAGIYIKERKKYEYSTIENIDFIKMNNNAV